MYCGPVVQGAQTSVVFDVQELREFGLVADSAELAEEKRASGERVEDSQKVPLSTSYRLVVVGNIVVGTEAAAEVAAVVTEVAAAADHIVVAEQVAVADHTAVVQKVTVQKAVGYTAVG